MAGFNSSYRGPGATLNMAAPYNRTAGQGALVGSCFGVAKQDVLSTVNGEFEVEGEFYLTKAGSQAWTEGQKIYWDDSAKVCTSVSTAGQLIGVATAACASGAGDTTGQVRLNGAAPSTAEGPQAAIVTLTDSTGDSGTHDDTLADGLTSVAPAAYSAHAAGAVAVTSNAATDLDTTAAAVANLRSVVATLVTDSTIQNQNISDLAQKVIEILARLVAAGVIAA